MATMIPSRIGSHVNSGEKRVFRLLERDPAARDWTVLHSLGLARRTTGPYGEIDFVVIIPKQGVVCLEVKGGRIACEDGVWLTTNRHGDTAILKKSPFMQVRDSMFALRNAIIQHFGSDAPESRCPIGCCVVFPDTESPPPMPEFERPDVIDSEDLRLPISRAVLRTVRHRMREFQPRHGESLPTVSQAKAIRRFLRPDFELVVAKAVAVGRAEERLLRLTEEQFARLDELDANRRCLFEGAAGTGKTVLAVEYARRASRDGSRVGLVCYNRLLGEWLAKQPVGSSVTSGTWHKVVRGLIHKSSVSVEFTTKEQAALNGGRANELFSELYPFYAELALEEIRAPFDVLVVDEAQDLSDTHSLDVLNLAVDGGLERGRWAFFGDFTSQSLYGKAEDPVAALQERAAHFVRARLTLNCRNTRRIAEEITLLSGFDRPPFRLGAELGLPVEHRYWAKGQNVAESLDAIVQRLRSEKMRVEDMIVLSPKRREASSLGRVTRIANLPIVDVSRTPDYRHEHAVKFSTVHSFKGLESPVVILVDLDNLSSNEAQSLLYVGMSRARSLLILLIKDSERKLLESRITAGIVRGVRN